MDNPYGQPLERCVVWAWAKAKFWSQVQTSTPRSSLEIEMSSCMERIATAVFWCMSRISLVMCISTSAWEPISVSRARGT
ncbi:hypothetical protein PHLCEN_2v6108 [Hermanssonia centrifuga]|uniref:Uncharacterized protein n=1 Tax=Hermanssonia centrifuga TaxID=98765 RepID=A0A2R6P0G1_9APHY|nr:hypothetical protein PHLCEN_2v6108 [Hermanssonia centrifuga]